MDRLKSLLNTAPRLEALQHLNSLQSDALQLAANRATKVKTSGRDELRSALVSLGITPRDITDRIRIIHVAGTKGKGSVCEFINSILIENFRLSRQSVKIGLYTSPHIVDMRERIRIDSQLLPMEDFERYVSGAAYVLSEKLGYFRFFTFLSYYVFLLEKVPIAVYETGVGGTHDSTNVIDEPAVTGITKLGLDHIGTLGPTLRDIARHKAGIIKEKCPVFTVAQEHDALEELRIRSSQCHAPITLVPPNPDLRSLPGAHRENASLAWAIAKYFLETYYTLSITQDQAYEAIKKTSIQGRYQHLLQSSTHWLLDGAHNEACVAPLVSWIIRELSEAGLDETVPLVIIYNQQGREDQHNGEGVLKCLYSHLEYHSRRVEYAIFCTNKTRDHYRPDFVNRNTNQKFIESLERQKKYREIWQLLDSDTEVTAEACVEDAIARAQGISRARGVACVLVTGSVHLVGSVLALLPNEDLQQWQPGR